MAIDDALRSGVSATARAQDSKLLETPQQEQEDPSVVADLAMAPIRGIEGAVQGLYDFADYATGGELLPNYDTRFLGKSNTFAGGLVEGVSNFLTGFIPIAGWLGKAGQVTKAGKVLGKPTAGLLARGKKLDAAGLRLLSKKKDKALKAARYVAAGAASDFLVFDGQEERLSNLITQFPELQNPVTDYLAATEDDNEIEGRFKNVIEGIFIEAGVVALISPFIKAVKTIKNRNNSVAKGLDKVDATEDAISRSPLTDDDFHTAAAASSDKAFRDPEEFQPAMGFNVDDFRVDDSGELRLRTAGAAVGRKATQEEIAQYRKDFRDRDKDSGFLETLTGQEVPKDTVLFRAESEGVGLDEFIESIINKESIDANAVGKDTDSFIQILKNMRDVIGANAPVKGLSNVKVRYNLGKPGSNQFVTSTGHIKRSHFDPENQVINLTDGDGYYRTSLRTIVHETAHAFSNHKINLETDKLLPNRGEKKYISELRQLINSKRGQKEMSRPVRELSELYLHVADKLGMMRRLSKTASSWNADKTAKEGMAYGMGNLDEFVAEAFSNPRFQSELAQITIRRTGRSAWSTFVDAIKRLIGLKNQHSTALDEVLSISETIFREQAGRYDIDRARTDAGGIYRTGFGKTRPRTEDFQPIVKDKLGEIQDVALGQAGDRAAKGTVFWKDAAEELGVKLTPKNIKALETADSVAKHSETADQADMLQVGSDSNKQERKQFEAAVAKITEAALKKREKSVVANIRQFPKGMFPEYKITKQFRWKKPTEADKAAHKQEEDAYNALIKESSENIDEGRGKAEAFDEELDELSAEDIPGDDQIRELAIKHGLLTKDGELVYPWMRGGWEEGDFESDLDDLFHAASKPNVARKKYLEYTYKGKEVPKEPKKLPEKYAVGEIDGKEVRLPAETRTSWVWNYKTGGHPEITKPPKETAEDYIRGKRINEGKQAVEDVKSGKRLREAVEEAGLKGDAEDMAELFTHMRGERVGPDSIHGAKLTFTDESGNIVEFKDLPEKVQQEVRFFLKARGGQVAKKPKAEEPKEGSAYDTARDENQLELVGGGLGDATAEPRGPSKPGTPGEGGGGGGKTEIIQREQRVDQSIDDFEVLFDEGGEQAILSAARTVRSDDEFAAVAEAAARYRLKKAKEQGNIPKTSMEDLVSMGRSINDMMGRGADNKLEAVIRAAIREGAEIEGLMARQMEIKRINEEFCKEANEKCKKALAAKDDATVGDADVLAAEANEAIDLVLASQRAWSVFGRNASLLLLQRKGAYDKSLGMKAKDFKSGRSAMNAYRDEVRGSMSEDKLFKLMADSEGAADMTMAINKIADKTRGARLFNMVREYWINSLLSGPATQVVNLLGSQLTYVLRSVEKAVGATLEGNFELARATLQYSFNVSAITDAFKLAAQAVKKGEPITAQNSRMFDDVRNSNKAITEDSARLVGADPGSAFGTALRHIGNIVRIPSRGLLVGDEFFKALNYRTYVKTELAAQGLKKGYRGKQLATYVKEGTDAYVTEGGRAFNEVNLMIDARRAAEKANVPFEKFDTFVEDYIKKHNPDTYQVPDGAGGFNVITKQERGGLSQRALQWAKENTHTQDSENGIARNLSQTIAQNPYLTFVVPFVRTPTNLLTFGVGRSPFGVISQVFKKTSKKHREAYRQATPQERAEINGRLATSVATTAGLLWLFQSGAAKNFITGHGPREKTQREAWEMNNQQYSIKVGGKWLSYNRADPMATILGIVADMTELWETREFDEDAMSNLFGMCSLSLANNVTNKSYVQGIDNLFNLLKDPPKNAQRFAGSIAGGFVPNALNQSLNFQENRELRETRNIMDYLIRRTPAGGKLSPRRNFLGEVETMSSSGGISGVVNPIYTKEILDDPVAMEFANLGQGFGKPGFYLRDGVKELDMRESVSDSGQDAYDRMLELMSSTKIRGKTLRQQLAKMFQNKRYQSLPDADTKDDTGRESPKVQAIRRFLTAYRTKARFEMLNEFPELKQRYRQTIIAARNFKQPQTQ